MTPELVLELLALVPVDPAEEARVMRGAGAVGDAVGPVLREAVLLREALQAGVGHRELHHDVRLRGLLIVSPQCSERFLDATFT